MCEISDKEIKKFTKNLEKANTAIWNAICYAEEIVNSNICNEFMNSFDDEHILLLEKIAKPYKKLKHNDDTFAEPEMYGRSFADYEGFTKELQKVLDKMEG